MQSVWWIGLALPAISVATGGISLASPGRRRVAIAAGAGITAAAALVPWLILRKVFGEAAPTFEVAFLQCAIGPIAIFVGGAAGMIVQWRRLKRLR